MTLKEAAIGSTVTVTKAVSYTHLDVYKRQQLGERLPCKQEVSGSIPLISTIWIDSSVG